MRKMFRKTFGCWLAAGIVASVLTVPALGGTARADYLEDAGMGTATVVANVVYVPVKLGYALLGGMTGGVAYVLTGANYNVAERVWVPSMGGNYVLSTDQLRGAEPIQFSAPTNP
jgi:hypothetical protein